MKNSFARLSAAFLGLLPFAPNASAQLDADAGSWYGTGSGATLTYGGTLQYANTSDQTSTDRSFTVNGGGGSVTTSGATLNVGSPYYSGVTISFGSYNTGVTTSGSLTVGTNPITYVNPPVATVPVSATPWSTWAGTAYSPYIPIFSTQDAFSVEAGEPFALGITAYPTLANYAPNVYAAWNLPPGTNFDASSGLIAGFISEPGTYRVTIGIGNNSGRRVKTITVVAAPPVPSLVLKAFSPRASYEGGRNGQFAVYLTKPTTVDLNVNYTVAGTAANGRDVEPLTGSLTIPAGETYGLIDVVPTPALAAKKARTVLVQIAPGSGYRIETDRAVKVTASYR